MFHYLITAVIDFTFAISALFNVHSRSSKAVAINATCLGFWMLELFLLTYIQDLELLTPLFHVTRWGMFFIPFATAFVAYRVVGKNSKTFKYTLLIPSLSVCIFNCVFNTFFVPTELQPADGGYIPTPDFNYSLFYINLTYSFIGSLMYSATGYLSAAMRDKQRIEWLLLSMLCVCVLGLTSAVLIFFNFYHSKFIGGVANVLFISLIYYTVTSRRLMDLRLAIPFFFANFVLLVLFISIHFIMLALFGDISFTIGNVLVLTLYIILIAFGYSKCLKMILPYFRKIFSKPGYDTDVVIKSTSREFNECITLENLRDSLDTLCKHTLNLSRYRLLAIKPGMVELLCESEDAGHIKEISTIDREHPLVQFCVLKPKFHTLDEMPPRVTGALQELGAFAITPVIFENELIAIVMIGTTENLQYYRHEELEIFQWISTELGKVLKRIAKFNAMQEELSEARKTLSLIGVMNQYNHDIKTPLAIIDGVLSTDLYDREKQREIVLEQVERGTQLIATMASILRGKRNRKLTLLSLEDIVQECIFVFENRFKKVSVTLEKDLKVIGDAVDLKILFVNVVKNASEAANEGADLELRISGKLTNDYAVVSIEDTGVGIPSEHLNTLWESGSTSKSTGSGIGLQVIKRIADEHDANIHVDSTVNQGTTFSFEFPALNSPKRM